MNEQPGRQTEVHPIAGVTAERMVELAGPLGWGDACRLLKLDEAVAAVRPFDFFARLDEAELTEVGKLAYECRWSPGVELFREGEEARKFCLLVEGQVALEMEIRLGPHSPPRRAVVEFMKPGDALGWSSLVAPFIYTKTAVAIQRTRALCLDSQALRNLMQRRPRVGMLVMDKTAALIASRLEHQSNMLLYFLSIISHELRAPLAAVENYLQVILSGYTGSLTQEQQTMLERSVLRLEETSGLIMGILDLARMYPEQIRQAFEPIDLHEVITEAVEDMQLGLKQKGLQLTLDVPRQLPQIVAAHGRLRQVLTNLLSNSIKFSPAGSQVRFVIRAQGDRLRMEVIDQGTGIPRDELDRIFEAFYRTHGAAETAGLGLGLSIVKRIVDAHRGRIWAESPYPPEGRGGSRFVVELPTNPLEAA
jgi:signal transduction histidine kinase